MAKIKKKGKYLFDAEEVDLTVSRGLWPGQELHHTDPSCPQTSNNPSRFSEIMYIQRYDKYETIIDFFNLSQRHISARTKK